MRRRRVRREAVPKAGGLCHRRPAHTVSWVARFAALILTPGAPLTHPAPHWSVLAARQAGVEVIGDIELFCRERQRHAPDAPFVAITGTNGKSTTTALIAHLMRVAGYDTQMGGNIGTAILSLEPPRKGRVHVIEMSSYQIDLSPSLDPTVGILINVSEDHIDRHGTLEHYAAVKERLVAGVQQQGTAIVGVDDGWCRDSRRPDRAGRQAGGTCLREKSACPTASMSSAKRSGARPAARAARSRGSAASARCAACTMRRMRPAPRPARSRSASRLIVLQNGLRSFPGLAHRMEQVGRRGNVLFVNDSKGTNADAAAHALSSFADIFWIAGGKPKARRHHGSCRIFPAYPQGLSDRRSRTRIRRARWARTRRTRFRRRSMSRSPTRRATPRLQDCRKPWCCCRRPARRSTSTAISKFAAPGSATSCRRCRASSRRCEPSVRCVITAAKGQAGDPVFQRKWSFEPKGLGVLDTPHARGMTAFTASQIASASAASFLPRFT